VTGRAASVRRAIAALDLGWLLGAFALVGLPLAVFAPLGMAPLAALAALAALPAALHRNASWPVAAAALLGLLCLWAAVTSLWALDRGAAFVTAMQLTGVAAAAFVLHAAASTATQAERERALGLLGAGIAVAALLVLVDMSTENALTRLLRAGLRLPLPTWENAHIVAPNRGATILSLATVPAAVLLWMHGRRVAAALLVLLVALAVASTVNLSSKTGLAVGLVCAVAAWHRPRASARVLAVVLVAAFVVVPPLARLIPEPQRVWEALSINASLHHRLTIWRFAAERIGEAPVLGWGMNAARSIPGGRDRIELRRTDPGSGEVEVVEEEKLPLHPHNAVLQIWLELGAVGAALAAALLLLLVRRAGADPAMLACIATAAAISSVSYGIWQSWWLSSVALVAAIVTASRPP
jgi:O-antigen ligase